MWPVEAHHQADQRALPGSVRTEHRDAFGGSDLEVEVVQNRHVRVPEAHAFDRYRTAEVQSRATMTGIGLLVGCLEQDLEPSSGLERDDRPPEGWSDQLQLPEEQSEHRVEGEQVAERQVAMSYGDTSRDEHQRSGDGADGVLHADVPGLDLAHRAYPRHDILEWAVHPPQLGLLGTLGFGQRHRPQGELKPGTERARRVEPKRDAPPQPPSQ